MGCGASKSGGAGETEKEKEDGSKATKDARKQSIFVEIPEIKVISGNAVKLTSFPRVIFIFGMVNVNNKKTTLLGFLPTYH